MLNCKSPTLYSCIGFISQLTLPSLNIPPFLSYAASYALYNYTLKDKAKGLEYDNLRLVRAFERGLDSKSSEAGFILTHIDMVKLTGALIDGAVRALDSAEVTKDRKEVNEALKDILAVMEKIEANMEGKFSSTAFQPQSHRN